VDLCQSPESQIHRCSPRPRCQRLLFATRIDNRANHGAPGCHLSERHHSPVFAQAKARRQCQCPRFLWINPTSLCRQVISSLCDRVACALEGADLLFVVLVAKNWLVNTKVLLDHGAWATPPSKSAPVVTPLHLAAQEGRVELLKMLLAAKGNPNFADSQGRTSLHLAAAAGQLECVRMLLANQGARADRLCPFFCLPPNCPPNRHSPAFLVLAHKRMANELTAFHIAAGSRPFFPPPLPPFHFLFVLDLCVFSFPKKMGTRPFSESLLGTV